METTPKKKKKKFKYLIKAGTIIISVWLICFLITFFIWICEPNPSIGTFGDSFGTINALFSGLAFAGLLYTIRLQKKELKDTRKEFEKQSNIFLEQKFDDYFFRMLDLVQSIRKEIIDKKPSTISKNYFELVMDKINKIDPNKDDPHLTYEVILQQYQTLGNSSIIFLRYHATFILLLEQIISKQKILKFDSHDYSQVINSQMDYHEIGALIMYSIDSEMVMDTIIKSNFLTKNVMKLYIPKHLNHLVEKNINAT
jgi:hypothetical protein